MYIKAKTKTVGNIEGKQIKARSVGGEPIVQIVVYDCDNDFFIGRKCWVRLSDVLL